MSPDEESSAEKKADTPGVRLDTERILEILASQSEGITEEVAEVASVYEETGQLPTSTVNSIRTEVMEFQSTVENFLVDECEGSEPWEHANELGPAGQNGSTRSKA